MHIVGLTYYKFKDATGRRNDNDALDIPLGHIPSD
jgi:hypothetical protein